MTMPEQDEAERLWERFKKLTVDPEEMDAKDALEIIVQEERRAEREAADKLLIAALAVLDLIAVEPLGESDGCFKVVNEAHRKLASETAAAIRGRTL